MPSDNQDVRTGSGVQGGNEGERLNPYEPDDSRFCSKCRCIMAFNNHKCVNEGRTH